jgi:non-specific serine/threonine protein kinase
MTHERWQRVKTIVSVLVDLDAEHQEQLLTVLCGPDDPQLSIEVRQLLASSRERGFVELADRLGDRPSPPPVAASGPRRIGRYEVIEQVGEGGMGVVYKARDPQLDRLVAIKLISNARRLDDDWRKRLVLEARAAAALDHPSIATVYEIGETEDGTLFLAMAFYEGETLAARLRRGPLPVPEALQIAREIAGGLAAAHARGITHRDLKPANVLLTRSNDVKIVDFGIAKLPGVEQTQTGAVLGSIAYMSPEQLRGEKVDPRADIWAFGVVLSEMLTGERFTAYSLQAGGPAPSPSSLRPEIPDEVDRIVMRALAARPADRYSDGSDLMTALKLGFEPRPANAPESERRFPVPEPITRFFGRQGEVDDVLQRLEDVRLLTLTGPGGTGKTRLALHVAACARQRFTDGVVFVPLAAIADPTLVCTEIARILGVPERPSISPADSLAVFLRSRRLLAVLDNFEHVASAAPDIIHLLTECANLRVLVTSRVPLRVAGEHEHPVSPLPHPPAQARMTAASLEQFPAAALFLDRARAVCPALATLADEEADAVAQICARLDGLPLAIELAAARAKLFSPTAMLRRLERPLELLNVGTRDRPARHQSLRHAIAWSYDLLTEDQQGLFRWLAIFSGGCFLDDATAVLAVQRPDIGDVTDACAALLDHSLIVREDGADGLPRVRMLETIREFALERLEATGEAHLAHRAHAEHYLALGEEAEPHLTRPEQAIWFDRLQIEHDNLRTALSWMQTHGHTGMALRLGAALWRFWLARGHLREGRECLAGLLTMPGADQSTLLRARVLNASATLIHEISDYGAARPLVEESLSIARGLGDRTLAALVLNNLAFLLVRVGVCVTAQERCEVALAVNRDLGNQRGTAVALLNLAHLADLRGDYDHACTLNEESLTMREAQGDTRGVAYAQIELARTEVRRGGFDRASALIEKARSTLERLGDRQLLAWALTNQGVLDRAAGRPAAALERFVAGVDLWRSVGNDWGLGFSLVGDAEAALDENDVNRASRDLDEALPLLRRSGVCWGLSDALTARARLAETLGDHARARELSAEAMALYTRMGDAEAVTRCREAFARLTALVEGG